MYCKAFCFFSPIKNVKVEGTCEGVITGSNLFMFMRVVSDNTFTGLISCKNCPGFIWEAAYLIWSSYSIRLKPHFTLHRLNSTRKSKQTLDASFVTVPALTGIPICFTNVGLRECWCFGTVSTFNFSDQTKSAAHSHANFISQLITQNRQANICWSRHKQLTRAVSPSDINQTVQTQATPTEVLLSYFFVQLIHLLYILIEKLNL